LAYFSSNEKRALPATQNTTTSPRFTIQNTTFCNHNSQKPQQKHPSTTAKKNTQKARRPQNRLSDFEAIGLQTARKPNSVLDDHSSTRRITAAL
jgi:hypothetical protein